MLEIINKEINIQMEFEGFKIIDVPNTNHFVRMLLSNETNIIINNKVFKKNVFHISDFTTAKEILSINKLNPITQKIEEIADFNKLFNYMEFSKLADELNKWASFNIVDLNEGSEPKMITQMIGTMLNDYFNEDWFIFLLSNDHWTDQSLFIINNVAWFNFDNYKQFLNEHFFIIITNDFRNYLNHTLKELELVCIVKWNYKYIDLLDSNRITNYVELETNSQWNQTIFRKFIDEKESYESLKIYNIIKNLC